MIKNKTITRGSLRFFLVLMVLALVAVPLSTEVAARRITRDREGFLDPFDLTVSTYDTAITSAFFLKRTKPASPVTAAVLTPSTMSETLYTTVSSCDIRIPYRPRPRSPILF